MELRAGYKQAQVGEIPEDWDEVRLEEVGRALIGLTYKPSDTRSHGTLVLRSSNIQEGQLRFDDNVYVNPDIAHGSMVEVGDLLICARNGSRELIGKSVRLDERARGMAFGAFMAAFRSPQNGFLAYQFQSELIRRQINEHLGATINQITNKSLLSFKVPLPRTTREKAAITLALSDADELIASLNALIAKKRDLKQAAMQQLLTGKTRLPGFTGEWEIKRLEELCSMKSGEGITAKNIDDFSPFPCFGGNGLRGFTARFTHEGSFCLIGRVGALCGNLLLVNGRFFASEHAIVASAHAGTDIGWLTLALGTLALNSRAESSAQPVLTVSKLAILELGCPPTKEEQAAIAAVLSDINADLAALEARRDKARAIRQGMMHELLTGRIRLV